MTVWVILQGESFIMSISEQVRYSAAISSRQHASSIGGNFYDLDNDSWANSRDIDDRLHRPGTVDYTQTLG